MAKDVKQAKRRRHQTGVPTLLVIALLAIAIVMGGLLGFALARHTNPVDDRLQKANDRIIELENTLNLIGYPMDENPEDFIFDDSEDTNPAAALSGALAEGEDDDVWTENASLLSGMLPEGSDPVVVAEFDGGQLMSTEVIPVFNDELTTQIFSGYSADEVSDSVLQDVLTQLTAKKIIETKIAELGLDKLTDAEQKAIEAQAKAQYQEAIRYYTAFVDKAGKSAEEITAAAEQYMRENARISVESIAAELKAALPEQKYRDYVVRDITVTDDEVRAYYDESLEAQKTAFTQYPEEFEYAHIEGQTLLYVPDGYRAVQNLLIPFENEGDAQKAEELIGEIERLDPLDDADKINALTAELDPLFAPLEKKADEITEKLKAGESFSTLLTQYGADEQMAAEPLRSEGYYISDRTFLFSAEFVQGAMILDAPGQVSAPLRSASGLHMAKYLRDLTPGVVSLNDVYDTMKAEALKLKQDSYYEEQTANMLDAADVRYYPERLQ